MDPNNGVTIFFNTFSGDMYRAIGISRASTNPHHNSMTTDLGITDVEIFGGLVPLGIKLFDGDGHSVKKNTIGPGTGEFAAGLTISSTSAGNSVANNNITADVAITIASDSNQVKNNKIKGDDDVGVELVGADFNNVNNNKITCAGGATGVSLDGSSDNNRVIVNRFTSCGTKVADGGSGNTVKNK